jgi:ssDNA-binding Zn-finger/Zn-ribbon topoisomerase 1
MGDEADALNDWFSGSEIDDPTSIHYMPPSHVSKETSCLRKAYNFARQAKTGTTIHCPTCGKRMKKKSYQHVFCSNKGRNNCKDRYWNTVDEVRAERARLYA